MNTLLPLDPIPLGAAELPRGAAPLTAEGPTAEIEVNGTRYAARSGRRMAGRRPEFPSAELIIARREGDTWRDIAFADEPLGAQMGLVALRAVDNGLRATYERRGAGLTPETRAVELKLPLPDRGISSWQRLPDYPQAPGMAGIVAGVHGGVAIAAGGANFPGRPPWEGGAKAYHDDIHVLLPGEKAWRAVGRLPEKRAYAAVLSLPGGVLVVGGENAETIFSDTLWLRWNGTGVAVERGPALPAPATSPAAAELDGKVYVAGGYAPGAVRTSRVDFWRLDLAAPDAGWMTLPTWPGPARGMAVMAALEGALYLVSGLDLAVDGEGRPQSTYLRDAYRYRAETWERLPDAPWSAIAAPSPAPVATNPARLFVLGGVDGTQAGKLPRDTRVPEDIAYFDASSHTWRLWRERWVDPVVTAPAVPYGGGWAIFSGETMAGVRTTSVWVWRGPEAK